MECHGTPYPLYYLSSSTNRICNYTFPSKILHGWEYDSMAKNLDYMCAALSLSPSTAKQPSQKIASEEELEEMYE